MSQKALSVEAADSEMDVGILLHCWRLYGLVLTRRSLEQ